VTSQSPDSTVPRPIGPVPKPIGPDVDNFSIFCLINRTPEDFDEHIEYIASELLRTTVQQ
jgi:hypothetical protein